MMKLPLPFLFLLFLPLSPARAESSPTEREKLVERGLLAAGNVVPVKILTNGVIQSILETGTRVKEGQVIAEMDVSSEEENLLNYRQKLEELGVQREQVESRMEQVLMKQKGRLALLKQKLSLARREATDAQTGPAENEERLLDISVERARLTLEERREKLERYENLVEKNLASEATLNPLRRSLEAAGVALDERRQNRVNRMRGPDRDEMAELESRVWRLERELERFEGKANRRIKMLELQLETVRAETERFENLERQILEDISHRNVKAPMDGILVVNRFRDWRSLGAWVEMRPGLERWRHDIIARVLDPSGLRVEFMVSEADFPLMKKGLPATVRVPALSDREFKGRLEWFGKVGVDRFQAAPIGHESSMTGVTVFSAIVEFDGEGAEFRPGMSAWVTLHLINEDGAGEL